MTNTIYQPVETFFYHELASELLPVTPSSSRRCLICSGRGLGKTELLEHLKQRLEGEESKKVCYFCACRQQPLEEMDKLRALSDSLKDLKCSEPSLLIDNLDYLLDYLWSQYDENMFRDMLRIIQKVLQSFPQEGNIYLSTTAPLGQLIERRFDTEDVARAWTNVWLVPLQQFEVQEVNPWQGSWSVRIDSFIHQAFRQLTDSWSPLEKEWKKATVTVTGGHPTLVCAAMKLLDNLLSKFMTDKISELSEFEQSLVAVKRGTVESNSTDRIVNYLLDKLSHTKLPILLQVLQDLKGFDEKIYRELVALTNGTLPSRDLSSRSRTTLLYHGLAHPDEKTGEYIVTGELLRQELMRYSDNRVLSLSSQETDSQSGKILCQSGLSTQELELSGVTWLIWRTLVHEKDKLWSVTEIAQHTGLKTDTAVRSALQRLGRLLEEKNIRVLENVRGKGYRIKGSF
jgi:hypothetical protein